MKKYNADAERIISLENSENYGRLHVSNFRQGSWSGYKKLIQVSDSAERTDMYTVKMPLWLFNRTPLRNFTSWSFENA